MAQTWKTKMAAQRAAAFRTWMAMDARATEMERSPFASTCADARVARREANDFAAKWMF